MVDSELLQQAQDFVAAHPNGIAKDQLFLVDKEVIDELVSTAGINFADRVLEIGPGLGFITKELAKRAKEVLAIELDEELKPYLDKLPAKVKVVYGDAYCLLNDRKFRRRTKPYTKTVSSIPYSQAQNMLHNYTNISWCQGDPIWLAPLSLVKKVNQEPILGAFFHAEVIAKVPKSAFYPQPHTSSAIIHFHQIPEPRTTADFEIYFRRWLYNNEDMKVKNALREGVIHAAQELWGKVVTKNEARDMVSKLGIPEPELEKLTNNIRPEYYFDIPTKLKRFLLRLP